MDFAEFVNSLSRDDPPPGLNPLLVSLWYDAKGDWEKSHDIVSEINSIEASLMHAYLHRKEGDLWNADYWYRRAGTTRKEMSLEEEWSEMVKKLIAL